MSERRKQIWQSYFWSLGIAAFISLGFLPVLVSVKAGWFVAILMALVATFVFGTSFFLLSFIRAAVRHRSFLLNLLVQTVLMVLAVVVPSAIVTWISIAVLGKLPPFDPSIAGLYLKFVKPSYVLGNVQITGPGVIIIGVVLGLIINAGFSRWAVQSLDM